jgi:hypothetical protein
MSEIGEINITITDEKVAFSTTFSIPETNFWLDQVKYLILNGDLSQGEE